MKFNSIKFLATALILIIGIISILIFGCFSFINTKANLERKYYNESALVLKHTMFSFQSYFEQAENLLNSIDKTQALSLSEVYSKDNNMGSFLNLLQRTVPRSRVLQLGMEDGRIFTGPSLQIPTSYDPRNQVWYELAKVNKDKIIWTEPYFDYTTQKIIITAAKTILDSTGNISGVMAVDYEVSIISKIISESRIGHNGFVMLLSNNGTVIANRDDYMIGEQIFGKDFAGLILKNKFGKLDYEIKGKWYHLTFDTIHKNGMFLITAISREEINENLLQAFFLVMVTGIICLFVFGITAYFSALRGIAPLEKLALLMKQAEKGNYNVSSKIRDYEEINCISDSFNNMIESIRKRDEKIKSLAYYDSLTGLANRENIIITLRKAVQKGSSFAVIYIDLDNFKKINDTMGHTVGNQVLIEVSQKFKMLVHSENIAARLGGDEFIIFINENNWMDRIHYILETIIEVLGKPFFIDKKKFILTASIGVAFFPQHGNNVEELFKKADMAMYRAKENGKNRYKIFNDSLEQSFINKIDIENSIRDALQNDEFLVFYQPLYNVADKRINGLEALLRTQSVSLNNIPLLKIIKIAEETGLIIKIEKFVFKKACLFAKLINTTNNKNIKVSVNISVSHIMQDDFLKNVQDIINETGVNPKHIGLEITETVMMESFNSNKEKLIKLQQMGIDIFLDDFGSGYSSLNYLQNLPINCVKIDKIFIDNMLNSKRDGRITAIIMELAHNIGLKVVAEGVEKKEQFELLEKNNCDYIQGYYLSRPVSEEEVLKLLL